MLKEILSITGKPGLFKIIAHSSRNIIVEDVSSKKRFPVSARDKIVSLGDISMYAESEDKPLGDILDATYKVYEGKPADVKKIVDEKRLGEEFARILPDYDRDRVYDKDIKKLLSWYNLLLEAGFTKFTEEKEEAPKEDTKSEEEK